jgi:hypothetical protein
MKNTAAAYKEAGCIPSLSQSVLRWNAVMASNSREQATTALTTSKKDVSTVCLLAHRRRLHK